MKIVVTGGTGLIGKRLIPQLVALGHEVVNLTTQQSMANVTSSSLKNIYWNPQQGELNVEALRNCHAIINLAGFSISNKWTERNKQLMTDSRIQSVRLLANAIHMMDTEPAAIITASAAGLYAPTDSAVDENQSPGNNFIAALTAKWEAEWNAVKSDSIRKVYLRMNVVLSAHEGAISKMLPFFRLGLGAASGSGKQLISWVHADDVVAFILYALTHQQITGAYNLASSQVLSNQQFSAAIAKALHKPFFLPAVPAFVMKLLFGEMASLILDSKNLNTEKLMRSGFQLKYDDIHEALNELFAPLTSITK